MNVIKELASSLNRRDEGPNLELARRISDVRDKKAVKELVENLANKSKDIQNDCIKTLYEIGNIKPSLIAGYANDFIQLLDSKNNRLQWGAMTALNSIAAESPKQVFSALAKLAAVADEGSVITRDHYVGILIKGCMIKEYADNAFVLLNEQLMTCPTNQLPMYAENVLPAIAEKYKEFFAKTLASRLDEVEKESKRRRVEKIVKKIQGR
ncbi:MAG: hypothetical protein J0H74_29630 [Chitinophagaceae bacterium]|nr:hypothetical protein [Chitinophagaceae bacterium]